MGGFFPKEKRGDRGVKDDRESSKMTSRGYKKKNFECRGGMKQLLIYCAKLGLCPIFLHLGDSGVMTLIFSILNKISQHIQLLTHRAISFCVVYTHDIIY